MNGAVHDGEVPVARVEAAVQAIVAWLERRAYIWLAVAILPVVALITLAFRLLDWRLALLVNGALLAVLEYSSWRLAQRTGRRAVRRFDREFPPRSSVRALALSILARTHSEICMFALTSMKRQLGVPHDVHLTGTSAAAADTPAVAPSVPLASAPPAAVPAEHVPLEVQPTTRRTAAPSSAQLYVPIDPVAPPDPDR